MARHTLPQSPFSRKSNVLVLHGFGIRIRVNCGHLEAEWGVGMDRHSVRLPRVNTGLRRVVVIGAHGYATFDAMKWITDVGASLIFLDRRGKVIFTTSPTATGDPRLRRAQAMAMTNGTALRISRELISRKLFEQERVLREQLRNQGAAQLVACFRNELKNAESLDSVRGIESQAAREYWRSFADLEIRWAAKDRKKIPYHWTVFSSRISPITHSPRLACHPGNSLLNLLYALLEAETTIACYAMGLMPDVPLLHASAPHRNSLALDLLEPCRPSVDAFVLNWIQTEVFRKSDWFEAADGTCRMMTDLAVRLCQTSQTWFRLTAPIVEWVAQQVWESQPSKRERMLLATRLTERNKRVVKDSEIPDVKLPKVQHVCPDCGAPAPHGQRCSKCGRESASKSMTELAKTGRLTAHCPDAQRKRSDTQLRHKAAQREWRVSPKGTAVSEQAYKEQIQPHLASVTISAIASALGVSIPYAADIRAGRRRPHRRHWQVLAEVLIAWGQKNGAGHHLTMENTIKRDLN